MASKSEHTDVSTALWPALSRRWLTACRYRPLSEATAEKRGSPPESITKMPRTRPREFDRVSQVICLKNWFLQFHYFDVSNTSLHN
jgi:hypothetical protein